MNRSPAEKDSAIWRALVESHKGSLHASRDLHLRRKDFCAEGVDRVALIQAALRGRDRFEAIDMLGYLDELELKDLFPDLIFFASTAHAAIAKVRQAILALPRDWVLANIEMTADPLLRNGTYDEFRRFLELYSQLDRDLTLRLARRAAEATDGDIREAGMDFLRRLDANGEASGPIVMDRRAGRPIDLEP